MIRAPLQAPTPLSVTYSDGYRAVGRAWIRAEAGGERTGILYLHGIQSHGGWYEWSASLLARRGAVWMPDRRGSGRNVTARGDVANPDRWLVDLDELVAKFRQECGAEAVDVVGVSWGGKLALAWSLRRPAGLRRLLLVAPGLFPRVDLPLSVRMRIAAALLAAPTRHFPIPLNDAALFTESADGQAFIRDDSIKLETATARFLYNSRRLDQRIARAKPATIAAPVTALLAGGDRIVNTDLIRSRLIELCASRPEIVMFPGASHSLEFEPGDAFQAALEAWRDGIPSATDRC